MERGATACCDVQGSAAVDRCGTMDANSLRIAAKRMRLLAAMQHGMQGAANPNGVGVGLPSWAFPPKTSGRFFGSGLFLDRPI